MASAALGTLQRFLTSSIPIGSLSKDSREGKHVLLNQAWNLSHPEPLLTLKTFPEPTFRMVMANRTIGLLPCKDPKRLLGSRTLSGCRCSSSVTCFGTCNHRPSRSVFP